MVFWKETIPTWFFWKPAKNHPDLRNWNSKSSSTSWTGAGDGMVEILAPVNRRMEDLSRWWFQICFYVHPYLGKIPILTNIFQMGWTTNQLSADFLFGHLKHQQYESPLSLVHFRSFKKHGGRGEHSNSLRGILPSRRECGLLPPAKKRSNSPQIQEFEELTLLIPIWIEMSVSPGWDPKPSFATHICHIRGFEKLNRHESTSFFPEKLLSKISNCVQLGNDSRFGIPFVAGKRNDFSMETLEEKGFLWLPFVWIWCQSKLGVSNSFFSLGTTPLWLRILFVVVLVSTCCAKKKKTRSFWWRCFRLGRQLGGTQDLLVVREGFTSSEYDSFPAPGWCRRYGCQGYRNFMDCASGHSSPPTRPPSK